MDEASLLDLLECSVCLERLDTTAKALPCQHTFCRRCLESIVSSRHELRCPECRILVGCGVDELPANILLVRLLDGIRQRPRPAAGAGPGPGPATPGSGGSGGGSSSAAPPAYQPAAAAASASPAAVAAAAAASLRELAAASRSALLGKVGAARRDPLPCPAPPLVPAPAHAGTHAPCTCPPPRTHVRPTHTSTLHTHPLHTCAPHPHTQLTRTRT